MKQPAETRTTLMWAALLAAELLVFGPHWIEIIWPSPLLRDFFQDWASIRFCWEGKSIYSPLAGPAGRLFAGVKWDELHYGIHNPHPPASLLPFVTVGWLDYAWGGFVWTLASFFFLYQALKTLWKELGLPLRGRELLIGLALLVPCSPLMGQVLHGQNNALVLWLIVAAWAAARRRNDSEAGLCLGAATALKLLPGLLFLYFLLNRRWRIVLAGLGMFLALQGVALALFGWNDFRLFFTLLGPHAERFRPAWLNQSLHGFFARLFGVSTLKPGHVPLVVQPLWGQVAAYSLSGLFIVATAWRQWRADTLARQDLAFALWLTTMCLVSPLTWDHYFLLLAPAFVFAWRYLPAGAGWAACYGFLVFVFWLHPAYVWNPLIPGGFDGGTAQPWQSLTLISYKHYGLWLLWGFLAAAGSRAPALAARNRNVAHG